MAKPRAKRAKAPDTSSNIEPAPSVAEAAETAPPPAAGDQRQEPKAGIDASPITASAAVDEQPAPARKPTVTPDPRPIMSASIGEGRGSPRMQLLRSHRFKQMQIRFDRQPEDHHLMKLKEAGWIDRTESEGIWTKQVAPGEWKPVADAERLFKDIANAIRKEKGLEPVLQGMSMA